MAAVKIRKMRTGRWEEAWEKAGRNVPNAKTQNECQMPERAKCHSMSHAVRGRDPEHLDQMQVAS